MRSIAFALTALAVFAGVAPVSAQCLDRAKPFAGELREIRTRDAAGVLVRSFHVVLPQSACLEVDGAATLEDVRSIELVAGTIGRENELHALIGERVEVAGILGAAEPGKHSGDVTLSRFKIIARHGRGSSGSDRIAGVDPEGSPAADALADAPTTEVAPEEPRSPDGDIRGKIARFVRDYYLSTKPIETEQIRLLYARELDYFGRARVSVENVILDKLGYWRRWPERRYRLLEQTLDVRKEADSPIYDVAFEYDFDVAGPAGRRAGRGLAILTVDLTQGEGRIVREAGEVVESQ